GTTPFLGGVMGRPLRRGLVRTPVWLGMLGALLGFLGFHPRFFPARDSGRHVLDVLVAKLFSGSRGRQISFALRVAAISDDQRILVLRQHVTELRRDDFIIEGPGHMPLSIGFSAIYVDYYGLLGFDDALNVGNAHIGEFGCEYS